MQIQNYIVKKLSYDYDERRKMADDPDSVEMPKVEISGENYVVEGTKGMIGTLAGWLRMGSIAYLFVGEQMCQSIWTPQTTPDVLKDFNHYLKENKMQFGMGAFFMLSALQSGLMQSGAFEIYINDKLEYSKLETGKMPNYDNVRDIFSKYDIEL